LQFPSPQLTFINTEN